MFADKNHSSPRSGKEALFLEDRRATFAAAKAKLDNYVAIMPPSRGVPIRYRFQMGEGEFRGAGWLAGKTMRETLSRFLKPSSGNFLSGSCAPQGWQRVDHFRPPKVPRGIVEGLFDRSSTRSRTAPAPRNIRCAVEPQQQQSRLARYPPAPRRHMRNGGTAGDTGAVHADPRRGDGIFDSQEWSMVVVAGVSSRSEKECARQKREG